MVALLKECSCAFNTFNILADEEVRVAVGGKGMGPWVVGICREE